MGCCSLEELGRGGGPVQLLGGRHALLDGGGDLAGLSGYKVIQEDVHGSAYVSVDKLGANG